MTVKEIYFQADTTGSVKLPMLSHSLTRKRSGIAKYKPETSALLVLDMQNYFLLPASHAFLPSAPLIINGIQNLIRAYTTINRPIIFTRHLNTIENAGSMAFWWRELLTPENPFSGLSPELDSSQGLVLEKSQYDAFFQTSLAEILTRTYTRQVVISGVMTHLCCETTARTAFMEGYEVFFLANGTATYNAEHHHASLLNLSQGFAYLVNVEDILSRCKV